MKSINLADNVVLKLGKPSFFDTRYVLARFYFLNLGASETIKDIPVIGLERTGQILHMRVTSSSSSVRFTLHSASFDKAFPLDIIQQAETASYDESANELWTHWDVTDSSNPYLWVTAEELAGEDAKIMRADLILCS